MFELAAGVAVLALTGTTVVLWIRIRKAEKMAETNRWAMAELLETLHGTPRARPRDTVGLLQFTPQSMQQLAEEWDAEHPDPDPDRFRWYQNHEGDRFHIENLSRRQLLSFTGDKECATFLVDELNAGATFDEALEKWRTEQPVVSLELFKGWADIPPTCSYGRGVLRCVLDVDHDGDHHLEPLPFDLEGE